MLFSGFLVDVWVGKPRHANVARVCAVLAVAGFAGAGKTAIASGPPAIAVRITEDLHEGCPHSPTMLVRLRTRLPRVREAAEGEPAVDVQVHVEQRGGISHGTIALVAGGERAERAASSASCERVLAALAVMAGIGLEGGDVPTASAPDESPTAPQPMPEPEAAAPVQPMGGQKQKTMPRPGPRPRPLPRPHFGIALGTSMEVSANPSLIVMPAVFGQLTLPPRFDPVLRLGFGRSFRKNTASAWGTVGLQWSQVTLAGCGDLIRQAVLRAGPCLNAHAGILEGVVIEPLPSRGRAALSLSAGASARLSWRPLRAVAFELLAGVRVPLIRNQLPLRTRDARL